MRFERESISTFTSEGELLLTVLASFAHAESESIASNIRWTIRKRFEEGIPNGTKAPYGYRWDREMFRIVPEQGEVVKEIFRRYLAGESAYSIAKDLRERGIVGNNGVPMCDSTIKDIVSRLSYTCTKILQKNFIAEGHVRKRNRGELPRYAVEEMYEPLVPVEDFEKAQVIRQRRAEELPEANPTKFSGLVKCGNCGSSISRRTAKGKKKWVCNTKERKGKAVCDLRHLPEEKLEAAAEKAIGATGDEEFRRIVRQICIYNDRIEFLTADGKMKSVTRTYGGFKNRNGFSGKLFCAECGSKLTRYTWCRNGIRKQSWGAAVRERTVHSNGSPRRNCEGRREMFWAQRTVSLPSRRGCRGRSFPMTA